MTLPYSGAPVSDAFRERWMTSAQVGDIKPVGAVQVRRGRLARSYHPFDSFGFPVFGEYPGALANGFWYPDWNASEDWMDLDAVTNIRLEQSFDNNGVTSCTITMDNQQLVPTTGGAGILYHVVEKGYYSPLRGYVPPTRPDPGVDKTPFFDELPNAQIRVTQGYGEDTMLTTFLGLIDEIESTSVPNQITITARDFGGVLVDEKFFGWSKEKSINSPITFATRAQAENSLLVGGGASASTTASGFSANAAMSEAPGGWQSAVQGTADDTQWIEFTIPGGRYSQIFVRWAAGMHAYVGVKPTAPPLTGPGIGLSNPTMDGGPVTPGVFIDPGNSVPGFFGGWPYIREIPATTGGQAAMITLGHEFVVGDNTVIRLGFRNLQAVDGGFAATVGFLQANQRTFTQNAQAGKFILIDDLSDIVRCCLRWTGFKDWEVENTGTTFARSAGPLVVDTSKSFMDIINQVKDYAGYTFFIAEPLTDDPLDIGRAIFRNSRVMENVTGPTEFIDDQLLLTDAKVKVSNADDHCIIRCRGIAKDNGVGIDGDRVHRIMFSYIPPWGRVGAARQAGVFKPVTVTNHFFTTLDDCQFGCYLVAIQIGLLKYTAILDLPCNPGIGLDTLQSVIDRSQGLNSRVYITNRTQEMAFGSNGYWTMELGGSIADSNEMVKVIEDFQVALKTIDRSGRNPWKRKRSLTGFQQG